MDALVARLGASNHGVVSVAQLRDLGLGKDAILARVRAGWLHRVHRGVYAVGHPNLTEPGKDLAAVLACGEGAVLSHAFAGARWRLLKRPYGPVHVTTPRHRRQRDGIRVHHSSLPAGDVTVRDGIPITTPARTLVDMADILAPSALRRALERAERAGLVDRRELAPRRGRRRVVTAPHRFTRSGVERRFLRLLAEHGLPLPETNQMLHGWEVDCLWREEGVVVEVDVYATHSDLGAFERDRVKQIDLEERGLRVRRITDRRIAEAPLDTVRTVRRALGLSPPHVPRP